MPSNGAKNLLLVFAVVFATAATALETPLSDEAAMSEVFDANTQNDEAPLLKKKSRLRFKNGPVCLCSDGLSEKDIRNAAANKKLQDQSEKKQ